MNTLFTRLLRSYVVVVLTAIVVTGLALSYLYTESVYSSKERELIENGYRLARLVELGVPRNIFQATVNSTAQTLNADITIANREGLVDLTTFAPSREPALRLSPSDVRQVLEQGAEVKRRGYEEALQGAFVTALVPIRSRTGIVGAVVLHAPLRHISSTIASGLNILLFAALLAAAIGVVVSYVLSRRITAPIQQMTSASLEMAQGNFDRRISTNEKGEVGALGRAFNELASRLGQTVRELTQEKQKMSSILTSINEGVIAVDSQGHILLVNPTMILLFDLDETIVGSPLKEDAKMQSLWPHLAATLLGHPTEHKEIRLGEKTLALHATPLRDEDDQVQGAVAVLHDVTEPYRLERMRRDFMANVSHELRTPLTSIRGFAQAILEGMVVNEEQTRRYLQVIMDESLRLSRLVNAVLDLSRIESKAVKLDMQPVDLGSVVTDAAEALEPICRERGMRIDVKPFPSAVVHADPDWMAQIFVNLLENAVRHSPAGGKVTVHATITDEASGRRIRVAVEDEGQGIPEDDLPYIWERFYKVDKSRRYQQGVGTGLGLVIVKEIVQMHRGNVYAENMADKGARFIVELPALNNPAD